MIAYQNNKTGFRKDVLDNTYQDKIKETLLRETGIRIGLNEQKSWESLRFMSSVLEDRDIPDDAGIAVEYKINGTSNRIDFLITGYDVEKTSSAVIIELKQWSKGIEITEMDGVVRANFYGGEVPHPSYQAWSYKSLLSNFNDSIEENNIKLFPCAFLHNYPSDNVILDSFYKEYLEKAPTFFKHDAEKLQKFIKQYVVYGDNKKVLYLIEHGKIRPSKFLSDSLVSMLKHNKEFVLIDSQKIAYETVLRLTRNTQGSGKSVIIIQGGPGTGKSVIAVNLLSNLITQGKNVRYVSKNSTPRHVYQHMLTGHFKKSEISTLFSSSDAFFESNENDFDVLLVDEAHRLTLKGGLYGNIGENQVREIIKASRVSVFFIDEDQKVTIRDVGTSDYIEELAEERNIPISKVVLPSQFRCNGSDGYLAWIDEVLQIHDTANDDISELGYDFRVFENPQELHDYIRTKNKDKNKSRMVAGYCWNWVSSKIPQSFDIELENYKAKWNLKSDGPMWIVNKGSVDEVGCIHTCQGLELEYVGVIIGPDLVVRNGKVVTDYTKRAKTDQTLKGIKKLAKTNPGEAAQIADTIIKNTYRTLMTRGMKGCFVYSDDEETRRYFSKALAAKEGIYYSNVDSGEKIIVE